MLMDEPEDTPKFLKSLSPGKALAVTLAVPSLYLLALALAWWAPKDFGFGQRALALLGLAVGLAGMGLWMLAMFHLGKSLAVLPGGDRLVTHGVYKILRHPIYLGIDLTFLGLFLAIGSTYGMAYLALVVLPLNVARARLEEQALLEKFGETYQAYRDRTWF